MNKRVRSETKDFNNNRVSEANNESEEWNIVKEVSDPKSNTQWELKTAEGKTTIDHQEITDMFNLFLCARSCALTCCCCCLDCLGHIQYYKS